jgi:hypothetical protein
MEEGVRMKYLITSIASGCLLFSGLAYGIQPVALSPISKSLGALEAGTTTAVTYTLTNNTGVDNLPVWISNFVSPVTLATNSCGSALKLNASCTFSVHVSPTNSQVSRSFNQSFFQVDYKGERLPYHPTLSFSVTAAPPPPPSSSPFLNAVGYSIQSSTYHPLIAGSLNSGSAWQTVLNDTATEGYLNSSACLGNTQQGFCAAVGGQTNLGGALLIYQTTNGQTWSKLTTSSFATDGLLKSVACTGNGSASGSNCIAAGIENGGLAAKALLLLRKNGTWSKLNVIHPSEEEIALNTVGCTDSSNSTLCVAGGFDSNAATPVLAESTSGLENTWTVISNLTVDNGTFTSVSCTGSSTDKRCVAVGSTFAGNTLIAMRDGSGNWSLAPSVSGRLTRVSCTGSGNSATCVAVGSNADYSQTLLLTSTDAGQTWVKNTDVSDVSGSFTGVSCTGGSGASLRCAAVGNASASPLYQATSGINSWVPVDGMGTGSLAAVNCTGSGSTAVCTAAGQDGAGKGKLAQTLNGGSTWSIPSISSIPSSSGFNGTANTQSSAMLPGRQ